MFLSLSGPVTPSLTCTRSVKVLSWSYQLFPGALRHRGGNCSSHCGTTIHLIVFANGRQLRWYMQWKRGTWECTSLFWRNVKINDWWSLYHHYLFLESEKALGAVATDTSLAITSRVAQSCSEMLYRKSANFWNLQTRLCLCIRNNVNVGAGALHELLKVFSPPTEHWHYDLSCTYLT